MRLLYFTRDYTTHDHRFLTALAQTGYQIYYLRLEQRGHSLEDRALPPQVEIVTWGGGQEPARLRDGPRLLFELKAILRKLKPDLVQAGPLQRSAFLVALAGFHPLVSMSWGYDLLVDAQRGRGWRWATRYTLQRSDALVGDCSTIRQLAISYGMNAERIVTFPWGIDLEHFMPAPSRIPESGEEPGLMKLPFTLLSTRGWEPIYGVETIAQAFVLAAQTCPDLRLVMLGNGSLAGRLRQILAVSAATGGGMGDAAGESGVGRPAVLFPGQIGYADLPRFYRSADLYLAATHSDGTSISLLEAMACGCPVLVSDIPGNREWVTPGENGWLFPVDDAPALARAILNAIEQRQRLPEMGRAARRIAEQRADWKANFPQLLHAYEIAVSRRR
jgi:glycosyltransferase involved in cell wall biosynthesis